MDLSNSNNQRKLITLKDAAQLLGVSVDALIQWNDFNILKPTITLSGEVGYTKEQIDKFISIQRPTHDSAVNREKEEISQPIEITQQTYLQAEESLLMVNGEIPEFSKFSKTNKNKRSSLRLISAFLAIIALIIVILIQQDKLKFLFDHNQLIAQKRTDNTKAVLASQINDSGLSDNSLKNEGINVLGNIFNKNYKGRSGTTAAGNNINQVPFALSKPTENSETGIKTDNTMSINSAVGYSDLANFPKNVDTADNLFDAGGNIKGETSGSNILALALKAVGVAGSDNSLSPAADSNVLLTIMALGLLFLFLVLRKQMYSAKMNAAAATVHNLPDDIERRKVLEINQKADGTVALCFQGKEYKLCKPDLDSESDQFIERLMKLAAPGVKEIDYDTLGDEEVRFNASLSKLVTRLGFVGIKRDLFFPRTSKNRVLFRRYITQEDLTSMNLTADQILNEF